MTSIILEGKMMITRAYSWFMNFPGKLNREEGQGLVEYALILVLIAIVVIAVLTTTGTSIESIFTKINTALTYP